jgi:hypothetical protein
MTALPSGSTNFLEEPTSFFATRAYLGGAGNITCGPVGS